MASLQARPISRTRPESRRDEEDTEPDWLHSSGEDRIHPDAVVRESALTPYLPERWQGARLDPGRRGLLALSAVGILVVLVAAYVLMRDAPEMAPVPALPVVQPISDEAVMPTVTESAPPSTIVVSVVGLVVTSGLVHLAPGSRVADALAAAGGTLDGADVLALNLAAKVDDGAQIVVGVVPPEGRPIVSGTTQGSEAGSGVQGPTSLGGAAVAGGDAGGKVDLNTASVQELDSLSGVGPVTAASIVSWRETNGPFTDVGQLAEVDGIGPVRLEKLRDQVTV